MRLAPKTFTAPTTGKVKVALKLSARNLAALKKARRLAFVVSVRLAGRTFTTRLTLEAPVKV